MYYLVLAMITVTMSFFLGHGMGKKEGMQQALNIAYKTNPPSEQLELVCVGLWLGEQHKQYYERDNRIAR